MLSIESPTINPQRIGDGEGVGDGDDLGSCSDGGITAGFGESGEECRWIAFHALPTSLKTNVIRPDAVSGAPL